MCSLQTLRYASVFYLFLYLFKFFFIAVAAIAICLGYAMWKALIWLLLYRCTTLVMLHPVGAHFDFHIGGAPRIIPPLPDTADV